ncbi:hypothetical protein D9613_009493 [Agrocybe pediades]|uniref:Uncharacterized protein n=1 Tax=Agrocybe pediades TaxID=84607 RepID=A0A8H4R5A6_9AGAR|nr:hypothetical protein D9613_009493 [Agrocybe pediades]
MQYLPPKRLSNQASLQSCLTCLSGFQSASSTLAQDISQAATGFNTECAGTATVVAGAAAPSDAGFGSGSFNTDSVGGDDGFDDSSTAGGGSFGFSTDDSSFPTPTSGGGGFASGPGATQGVGGGQGSAGGLGAGAGQGAGQAGGQAGGKGGSGSSGNPNDPLSGGVTSKKLGEGSLTVQRGSVTLFAALSLVFPLFM